eukprot:gene9184-19046_t
MSDNKRKFESQETRQDAHAINTEIANVGNFQTAMKILVSQALSGPLIGKGGTIISEINKSSNAQVRISSADSLYPGTSERVAVIRGEGPNVMVAIDKVVSRIFQTFTDNHERRRTSSTITNTSITDASQSQSSSITTPPSFTLKIVVPAAAAGCIIGKGGDRIRMIRDLHGCQLRMADAADPFNTKERVLTISAPTADPIIKGIQHVLLLMMQEPSACTYVTLETDYKPINNMLNMLNPLLYNGQQGGGGLGQQMYYGNNNNNTLTAATAAAMIPLLQQQQYQSQDMKRVRTDQSSQHEQQQQMYVAAYHHQQMLQQPSEQSVQFQMSTSLPDTSGLDILQPSYTTAGHNMTMTIGVADGLVGGLIGKGGMILKDIKDRTGVVIKVSQKGELLPGTDKRSVTVTGSYTQVQCAHAMVMQRLVDANRGPQR